MKKSNYWVVVIIAVLGAIMILHFFCYSKTNLIEKNFGIILPKDAHISEFHRSFDITGTTVAAKIIISHNNYNDFISNMSKDYIKFNPTDYTNEIIDDIVPPESDRTINIERFDEDLLWWDLETNQITLLFYYESANPRPFVRIPCVKRIYVSEQYNQITLYLYCIQ